MGPEDLPQQQSRIDESSVTSELRLLKARVEALERQLAELQSAKRPVKAATVAAPPPPPLPVSPSSSEAPSPPSSVPAPSLENRLGAQIFNRVGILALMIGATLFLKLAIDNQWIGPVGRILIGLVAGAGIVLWSEQFRRKGFAAFSYSLKAIGAGVLYLSLWAAYQLYHLLPSEAALGGMILVTAWNAYMAWAQNAELLAAYALAGGLATPLLLSTGGNHEAFLFIYLLAIDAATVALVRMRPWPRLLLGAFTATVLYFIGWYVRFYAEPAFAITTVFVGLFFLVFAIVPLGTSTLDSESQSRRGFLRALGRFTPHILLPSANAAFVSLALYSVMQDSDRHWFLPWLMLILAAAYLLLAKLPQAAVPAAMHLSLAVVFLTIAIPLKASGHWITIGWLIEGVALLWVACRTIPTSGETAGAAASSPSHVLRWLSAGALVLGLTGLIVEPFWFGEGSALPLLNHNFATAVAAALVFAGAGWLALRARRTDLAGQSVWTRFTFLSAIAIDIVGLILSLREIATSYGNSGPHAPFLNADFGMALVGLLLLAAMAWGSLRFALNDQATLFWVQIFGGSIILFNLVAILIGVREIHALWPLTVANSDSELQRALTVSAFLMLYGAALLAIGFWRRTAFIRWQALILLVFTIGKTFLYDMRSLSEGYRVASLVGLGVLLMAVSFAYQKDWLALRNSGPSNSAGSGQ
ncbi:MAG TPA: DUF2339 domain-containing protein [Edaphobacter sp.]|jgi:uncharacterized membrane protein|nr:DUF2339 domain-containing protein [Edaphobacter sp.]